MFNAHYCLVWSVHTPALTQMQINGVSLQDIYGRRARDTLGSALHREGDQSLLSTRRKKAPEKTKAKGTSHRGTDYSVEDGRHSCKAGLVSCELQSKY